MNNTAGVCHSHSHTTIHHCIGLPIQHIYPCQHTMYTLYTHEWVCMSHHRSTVASTGGISCWHSVSIISPHSHQCDWSDTTHTARVCIIYLMIYCMWVVQNTMTQSMMVCEMTVLGNHLSEGAVLTTVDTWRDENVQTYTPSIDWLCECAHSRCMVIHKEYKIHMNVCKHVCCISHDIVWHNIYET